MTSPWITIFRNILKHKNAIEGYRLEELPEEKIAEPQTRIVLKAFNLSFHDIPTLVLTVDFRLVLEGAEKSAHIRVNVTPSKTYPTQDFLNDFNLVERKLEECCEEFDDIRNQTPNSRQAASNGS